MEETFHFLQQQQNLEIDDKIMMSRAILLLCVDAYVRRDVHRSKYLRCKNI